MHRIGDPRIDQCQPVIRPRIEFAAPDFVAYESDGSATIVLHRQGGTVRSLLAIQRAMQIAASEEMTRFERNLPWLATSPTQNGAGR